MSTQIHSCKAPVQGALTVPGDKSISHRALMFGALAQGTTTVSGLLKSEDVLSTWQCLTQLGVTISEADEQVHVQGVGGQLTAPSAPLDCGNSGTTMRLMMGILAGQPFGSTLIGDASLHKRPMKRVAEPLSHMGAQIQLTDGRFPPVQIYPAELKGAQYALPIASAQVKSALILAAHFASGTTTLTGELDSRDHTERLLPGFGAQLDVSPERIIYSGGQSLKATHIEVPSDPSSAAFWATLACMHPGSHLVLNRVSLNPTRLGFFKVLERMGADIQYTTELQEPEPMGRIEVRYAPLTSYKITPQEVASLIDEIPLLALLATQATGVSTVRGAEELRVKESDRLLAMTENLKQLGVVSIGYEDGFDIAGPQPLQKGSITTYGDHRIAMTFSLAATLAQGPLELDDTACINISYPGFYATLKALLPQLQMA